MWTVSGGESGRATIQTIERSECWMDGVITTRYTLALLATKQLHDRVHSVSVQGASVNFKSEVLGDVVHAGGGIVNVRGDYGSYRIVGVQP